MIPTVRYHPRLDVAPEPARAYPNCYQFRVFALLLGVAAGLSGAENKPTLENSGTTLAQLVNAIRGKARELETRPGMKSAFDSFRSAFKLQPGTVALFRLRRRASVF